MGNFDPRVNRYVDYALYGTVKDIKETFGGLNAKIKTKIGKTS